MFHETYHHHVCHIRPKNNLSRMFMKIGMLMHITSLIMEIIKLMFFSPPGGVAVLFLLFQLLFILLVNKLVGCQQNISIFPFSNHFRCYNQEFIAAPFGIFLSFSGLRHTLKHFHLLTQSCAE